MYWREMPEEENWDMYYYPEEENGDMYYYDCDLLTIIL